MQPYPPLQTLLAAAMLREQGVEVAFFDTTFNRDFVSALDRVRPDLVAVCEDNFNFLTKMCLEQNRRLALEIAQAAGALGIRAVINSSDATTNPHVYLESGFDSVILGELEDTLADISESASCGDLPKAGTASDRGLGHPRAPISDLDRIPPPAWDLVDLEPYRRAWVDAHGHFAINLVASRGCPYRCNWCAKPIYGSMYRFHSPDRVARDMQRIKELCRPDQIWFADDIFGLSGKWVREFASCVERRNAAIPFRIQSRCDLMTRDTVAALRRAGCVEVWMGAESGSQRVLDAMDKGTRVAQIDEARENLRRHGIRACLFLQFGYLGEEWEDIESTIKMIRRVQPDDIGVSVSYPMQGTRFYNIAKAQIGAKANWSDSGELARMLRTQFPSDLYRALAEALHREVRRNGSAAELRRAWERVEDFRCVSC
ncbi:MAG: B12-binding domain-containing radical SAM protein [Bryobacterales bacterium]|nr:B12-binding domain-containing radical SAM protein [Bryobacterales bacterium]MBV9398242.1 B12-binding domain-containing radical SAM protein [Bryobacterales bacterium]